MYDWGYILNEYDDDDDDDEENVPVDVSVLLCRKYFHMASLFVWRRNH